MSIYNQTFQDFECLLVDNNSTDRSSKIAYNWTKKDLRFKYVKEKKQGVVHASNLGSQLAVGEYIARMDADDIAMPNRLEDQYEHLEKEKHVDAVAGKALFIAGVIPADGFRNYVEWSNSILTFEDIKLKQFIESTIINPTAMWRKSSEKKYGGYRTGSFPEDYEMWLRWLGEGAVIEKLDKYLLKWQDSAKRLTRTDPIYSTQAFYEIKTKYLVKWLEKNNPFHPNVIVWGASRMSRRRAELMKKYGINILGYIDISNKRQIDENIIYYEELPNAGSSFILTYINHLDVRLKVANYLKLKGYTEGKSFMNIS